MGSKAFKLVCVNKIQCLYRGYRARKRYYVGLKSFYRLGKGDNRRRKIFYEKELSTYANSIVRQIDDRKSEIDSMLT